MWYYGIIILTFFLDLHEAIPKRPSLHTRSLDKNGPTKVGSQNSSEMHFGPWIWNISR